MNWKTGHRSFYYQDAPEPEDLSLQPGETALLCIDVQNYGLAPKTTAAEQAQWAPFYERMRDVVIPNLQALQEAFRKRGMDAPWGGMNKHPRRGRSQSSDDGTDPFLITGPWGQ